MRIKIIQYRVLAGFFWEKLRRALSDFWSDTSYFDNEIERENQVIRQAATQLGMEVVERGGGMLEIRSGKQSRFLKGVITEIDSAAAFKIAGDKFLTHQLLKEAQLPIPPAVSFHKNQVSEAIAYFRNHTGPVVVKPRRGTGAGAGITVRVEKEGDFITAFFRAALHDNLVLVEDFVPGDHFRVLVICGKAISVLKRIPATVTGDGKSTIKELVTSLNRERQSERTFPEVYPIPVDDDLRLALKHQGLSLKTVPERGTEIPVKTMCNYHQGGTIYEVIDKVHPDYLEMCQRAAHICRVNLAGVDLIADDITKPFVGNNAAINEVNTTPSLYVHYQIQNQQKVVDVSAAFLTTLFQR